MTTFRGPPIEAEEGLGPLTLGGFLTEVARRHGEREALVFHPSPGRAVRWSYRDLEGEARRVARALLAAGLQKGARVALLMGNRPEWVASAYGTALAGGVLVPVNTYLEPPELDYLLRHADASVLLMQRGLLRHAYLDQLAELCPELDAASPGLLRSTRFPFLRRVACLGLDAPRGAAEPWESFLARGDEVPDAFLEASAAEIAPADDALIIYTSGTTATPKGVLHAHRGPALQAWRFPRHLALDPDARTWSAFPFFWTAGLAMVMGATLAVGACVVLQEHFEPGEALRLMEAERVTTPHAWAHQTAALEEHPDWQTRDLSSIRHAESFGPFGRHKTVRVPESGYSARSAYGLTETFTLVTSVPADGPPEIRDRCQGRLLAGTVLRILHPDTGAPQPAGADGEIAVKGPTLMKGYWKVPPEQCFDEDGFFHTGDAGYVDEEGYLYWTGRTSEMIKTGGANVSPVELELALARHPMLKTAVAVGVPHPTLGEMVVVCAVPHEDAKVDEQDVQGFLRGRLASYKIPRRVLFFRDDELALTGSQKIRIEDLRALATARLQAAGEIPSRA